MHTSLSTPALLAEVVAANLLPLYFALLAGALALAASTLLSWRRLRPGGAASAARIASAGAVGVGIASGAFALIAAAMSSGHALTEFDDALVTALSATQPADTLRVFARLTHFGDTATLTALGIGGTLLLVWRRHLVLAATWAAAIAGNSLLNVSLKALFERVRPVHDHGFTIETSWSFPSGHASGTVAAWGIAAYVLLRLLPSRWHLPVVLAAVAIALTTAVSRVVLQVHFASDVLAGMASGAAWLTLCITLSELLRRRVP